MGSSHLACLKQPQAAEELVAVLRKPASSATRSYPFALVSFIVGTHNRRNRHRIGHCDGGNAQRAKCLAPSQ